MGTEALRIQPGIQSRPLATRTSQTWPGRRALQGRNGGGLSAEDRASETELIRQAQKGSRQAFDTLVRQYDQAVLRLALHLLGSETDAQDIAQESLFKLTRYREQPENVLRFLLYRIATNGLRDAHRSMMAAKGANLVNFDASNIDIPCESLQPEERAEHHQELARIRDIINRLPERRREIYLLNRIDGMSYTEIAKHCDISVKAVEKHIGKALSTLRKELAHT